MSVPFRLPSRDILFTLYQYGAACSSRYSYLLFRDTPSPGLDTIRRTDFSFSSGSLQRVIPRPLGMPAFVP